MPRCPVSAQLLKHFLSSDCHWHCWECPTWRHLCCVPADATAACIFTPVLLCFSNWAETTNSSKTSKSLTVTVLLDGDLEPKPTHYNLFPRWKQRSTSLCVLCSHTNIWQFDYLLYIFVKTTIIRAQAVLQKQRRVKRLCVVDVWVWGKQRGFQKRFAKVYFFH